MVLGRLLAQAAQTYIRDTLIASPRFRDWARRTDQTLQQAPDVLGREMKRRMQNAREQVSCTASASMRDKSSDTAETRGRGAFGGDGPGRSASDLASRASAFASALREELEKDLGATAGQPNRSHK